VGAPIYSHGYQLYPDPYLVRFFAEEQNRKLYGLLKIDGPDRQHRNVHVVVNDEGKGVASKYDQKVNGMIVVRVRDTLCDPGEGQPCEVKTQKVQFKREENGRILRATRYLGIESFEVTGFENMHWERVDNNTFKNAEILDELEQQGLPETEEAGVVPSRKKQP